MCGIVAIVSNKNNTRSAAEAVLQKMEKRGPDSQGIWSDETNVLGHRRLSIIDLDPRSDQPFHSECGGYVIVFNGEIYNHNEIRQEMVKEGVKFKTESDTEVLLEAFIRYGESCLVRLRGMFAFVICEKKSNRLVVGRDPYGIKPLYIATNGTDLIIASQVKAISASGLISLEHSQIAKKIFSVLGSIPEPMSYYQAIHAIPAGSITYIKGCCIESQRRWGDIRVVWKQTDVKRQSISQTNLREHIKSEVEESIRYHLEADVPIAIFLSGGVDSGILADVGSKIRNQNITAITVTFEGLEGTEKDEGSLAKEIANSVGIPIITRKITYDEFVCDLPKIIDSMDQPSVDGVNSWYASKIASENGFKVAISGVGADELFFGYEHFDSIPRLVKIWRIMSMITPIMWIAEKLCFAAAILTKNTRWENAPEYMKDVRTAWLLQRSYCLQEDYEEDSQFFNDFNFDEFRPDLCVNELCGDVPPDDVIALSQIESTMYLKNQLLRDLDWASMYHSVELRTPFVDSHLLGKMQPYLSEISKNTRKTMLKSAFSHSGIPERVFNRKKTGFSIPIDLWISRLIGKRTTWLEYVRIAYSSEKL
jgi:asparagine synthase (glutamine-hydrolysing)